MCFGNSTIWIVLMAWNGWWSSAAQVENGNYYGDSYTKLTHRTRHKTNKNIADVARVRRNRHKNHTFATRKRVKRKWNRAGCDCYYMFRLYLLHASSKVPDFGRIKIAKLHLRNCPPKAASVYIIKTGHKRRPRWGSVCPPHVALAP